MEAEAERLLKESTQGEWSVVDQVKGSHWPPDPRCRVELLRYYIGELARVRTALEEGIAALTTANDETPETLCAGIRLLELTLNAEHERAEQAKAERSVLQQQIRSLVEQWGVDASAYPMTSEGIHAAAAVRLCARELLAVLSSVDRVSPPPEDQQEDR